MVFLFNVCCFFILGVSIIGTQAGVLDFTKLLNKTDPDSEEFTNLVNKFKMKLSDPSEVSRRLGNFRRAKQNLKGLQSRFKNAKFGLNKFSLMSTEEQQKFLGARVTNPEALRNKRSAINNIIDPTSPASFDFRTYGKVTPIKNQAQCGSCWTFTTAGAIESQYLLRYNQTLDLSEQNLVSCSTYGGKCNGGDVVQTLDYVKTNGITTEACYPYTATNGTCTTACNNQKYYIGGYHYFGTDESTYATQLYNYGPATMVFNVPQAFMSYSSGILDMPAAECAANNIGGHGIVIVGYTADYWIAKNSWGTDWGENGFVRFRRGQNFCGMTTQVTAPFLNTSATLPSTVAPTVPPSTTTAVPLAGCSAGNGVTTMNNAVRNYALQLFNGKRSNVAKGTFVMSNGINSPAAKNMNKLAYNCTFETAAQNYINSCNASFLLPGTMTSTIAFPWAVASINESLTTGVPYFFGFTVAQSGANAMVTAGGAAFAFDNAAMIGCALGMNSCSTPDIKSQLVCVISPYPTSGAPLYAVGSACTANSQCTKTGYSNCDTTLGLCYA